MFLNPHHNHNLQVLELQLNEGEKRCNELVCELEVLDKRCKHLKSEEMKFKRLELVLEKICKDLES